VLTKYIDIADKARGKQGENSSAYGDIGDSVKSKKERENPARIAMRYLHTDLYAFGHGV